MKFILGKKLNMTQVFDKDANARAATILDVKPVVVTQVRTVEKDGYSAVQIGAHETKPHRINKAQKGHFKDLGNFHDVREFRMEKANDNYKIGDKMDATQFKEGDTVQVTAISKGKGFQGVVKRHGFGGGPRTHGQKHSEREPGSIGGGLRNKVPKKMRMAGRMGGDVVTVKNLKVLHVDSENNKVYLSGAVPGRRGTVVEIIGQNN
ncbi:MAG: 50S ribosomal protein L3 [Patescibacteria group bacterium]